MVFTDKTIEKVKSAMGETKNTLVQFEQSNGYARAYNSENQMVICRLEQISQMIDELTVLKQIIEKEVGVIC